MSIVTTSKNFSNIITSFQTAKFGEATGSRKKAIEILERIGLPEPKHEEYQFTPLTRAIDKIFTWENKVAPSQLDSVEQYLVSGLDANILVFVNGQYSETLSKIVSPAYEVKIKSLYEWSDERV